MWIIYFFDDAAWKSSPPIKAVVPAQAEHPILPIHLVHCAGCQLLVPGSDYTV